MKKTMIRHLIFEILTGLIPDDIIGEIHHHLICNQVQGLNDQLVTDIFNVISKEMKSTWKNESPNKYVDTVYIINFDELFNDVKDIVFQSINKPYSKLFQNATCSENWRLYDKISYEHFRAITIHGRISSIFWFDPSCEINNPELPDLQAKSERKIMDLIKKYLKDRAVVEELITIDQDIDDLIFPNGEYESSVPYEKRIA